MKATRLTTESQTHESRIQTATRDQKADLDAARSRSLAEIHDCRERDRRVVEQSVERLDEFFEAIRPRVGPLVDDLSDWGSTAKILWKSGWGWWNDTDAVAEYVQQFLHAYLQIPDGFEVAAVACQRQLGAGLLANEQQLYVKLEPDLQSALTPISLDRFRQQTVERVRHRLQLAAGEAVAIQTAQKALVIGLDYLVISELEVQVGRILAVVLPRVLAPFLARAGVSAAGASALGVGAANSWWSFGISLIAGAIIGWLLDVWLGNIARAEAVAAIDQSLETLQRETRTALLAEARRLVDLIHQARCELANRWFSKTSEE
jgi:hypothetical protein